MPSQRSCANRIAELVPQESAGLNYGVTGNPMAFGAAFFRDVIAFAVITVLSKHTVSACASQVDTYRGVTISGATPLLSVIVSPVDSFIAQERTYSKAEGALSLIPSPRASSTSPQRRVLRSWACWEGTARRACKTRC